MSNIIFITGMAGAGKSTGGRLVAQQFPKCLFIQGDELREKMLRVMHYLKTASSRKK